MALAASADERIAALLHRFAVHKQDRLDCGVRAVPCAAGGMMFRATVICVLTALALCGCRNVAGNRQKPILRLATTTSVDNSGLLEILLEAFHSHSHTRVEVLSMGTGSALQTARNGDCDLVLVHSPQAEEEFVSAGWGIDRRVVMYNYFAILGPADDPTGVREAADAAVALAKIASSARAFCSRGDDSGTHNKEMQLWQAAGVSPQGDWYLSIGQGMAATLTLADQKQAYVLSDLGTFLALRKRLSLEVLCNRGEKLLNTYSVIAVSPTRHPNVRLDLAAEFMNFLVSPQAQKLIDAYRVNGEQLFHSAPAEKGYGSD